VRWIQRILLGTIVLTAVIIGGQRDAAAYTNGAPDTIGALGDSITQATNFDQSHFGSNLAYSWSTGENTAVQSLYYRILQGNPNINTKNFNYSVNGAKMTDLNGQAVNLNATPGGIELVTIEMGGNDVCTSSEATMTPVPTYRSQFQTAINTLTTGFPNRRVFVVSIPDVYQLWAVLHTNQNARNFWAAFSICQSLLANPESMLPADVQRRANVRQRNIDFNTQLAEVCALYPQCTFDNNAIFNGQITAADVSNLDYFHPSLQGQINLAAGAWAVYDMDDDGWASISEGTIGTDPLDNCADNASDNAWPADINNNGFSDTGDIGALTNDFGDAVPANAPARHDIAPDIPDGFIDTGDLGRMTGHFGEGCGP
jgi:lysophospholipase L1-like esterase